MKEEHKSQLKANEQGDCGLVWSFKVFTSFIHDVTKEFRFTRTGARLKDWVAWKLQLTLKRSFRGGVGNKITLLLQKDYDLVDIPTSLCCSELASGLEWSQVPSIFHRVTWSGQPCSINKTFLREKSMSRCLWAQGEETEGQKDENNVVEPSSDEGTFELYESKVGPA